MPPVPPRKNPAPKGNRPPASAPGPAPQPQRAPRRPAPPPRPQFVAASVPPQTPGPSGSADVGIAVAADAGVGGVVTARRAGGLRDMGLEVDPDVVGIGPALQNLAKAINIAFQTDYGENYLETVYQAAIVRNGEIHVVHKEYFGYRDNWFGEFGMLLKSLQLTFEGPDPASPEGQARIKERGASTIRGLFNFLGRKLDLVSEFEDRVPAYVEQMFDRLEASGIITGWDREDWRIWTTKIGLNIRIAPAVAEMQDEVPGEG